MTPPPARATFAIGAILTRLLVVLALLFGGMPHAAGEAGAAPAIPVAEADRGAADAILAEARAVLRAPLPGDPAPDPVLPVAPAAVAQPGAGAMQPPSAQPTAHAFPRHILPPVRGPPAA